MNGIEELIDKLSALLYVIIPAIYLAVYKIYTKIKGIKQKEAEKDKKRNEEIYNIWEHEESKHVIANIKTLCNLYKDRGHSDLVQYLQLENGTMATSKIQNMFVTCLAEDDRYGCLPKLIRKLQRLPYSETVSWLSKLTDEGSKILMTNDVTTSQYSRTYVDDVKNIGSVMAEPVYDQYRTLVGVCIFYYHEKEFNGQVTTEMERLHEFTKAVESCLLQYHISRDDKKKQLKLEEN